MKIAAVVLAFLFMLAPSLSAEKKKPKATPRPTPTTTPKPGASAYERMLTKHSQDFDKFEACERQRSRGNMAATVKEVSEGPRDSAQQWETAHAHDCDVEKNALEQEKLWLTTNDPPRGVERFDDTPEQRLRWWRSSDGQPAMIGEPEASPTPSKTPKVSK